MIGSLILIGSFIQPIKFAPPPRKLKSAVKTNTRTIYIKILHERTNEEINVTLSRENIPVFWKLSGSVRVSESAISIARTEREFAEAVDPAAIDATIPTKIWWLTLKRSQLMIITWKILIKNKLLEMKRELGRHWH